MTTPGVFTERVHLYLARDLRPVPAAPEPEEVLEVHWIGFAEALARGRDHRCQDRARAPAGRLPARGLRAPAPGIGFT